MNSKILKAFTRFATLSTLLLCTQAATAQGKHQGAVVTREGAAIYQGSTGEETLFTAKVGQPLGLIATMGPIVSFKVEEENERIHVLFFQSADQKGMGNRTGWISSADVRKFVYDCSCGAKGAPKCDATTGQNFSAKTWNACFLEKSDPLSDSLKAKP